MSNEKQLTPVAKFQLQLQERSTDFKSALPPHITPEKFMRVVTTAAIQNPELLNADRGSLFMSALAAAQDGLLPDKKESAFVVFNTKVNGQYVKKVQYMPMVAGIFKKIRNSKDVASISAHAVFTNDEFDYELGDNEFIKHKPAMDERGEFKCVYAIAKLKDGGDPIREVMSKSDIEKVRSVSKSKDGGTWTDWYEEMAKKTVIRRLSKRLPMSAEVEQMFERDNNDFDFSQQRIEIQQEQRDQLAHNDIANALGNVDTNQDDEMEINPKAEQQANLAFEEESK